MSDTSTDLLDDIYRSLAAEWIEVPVWALVEGTRRAPLWALDEGTPREPRSVLRSETVEQIVAEGDAGDMWRLNDLRMVSSRWNSVILSVIDRERSIEKLWRAEHLGASWRLVTTSPAFAVRFLDTLPDHHRLMESGRGEVACVPKLTVSAWSFIGHKAPYVAEPPSSAKWTPTPAFFKVLDEKLSAAYSRFFPELSVEPQKQITWQSFKAKLDRTIYYDDDNPSAEMLEPGIAWNRISALWEELPQKMRVEFPRPIRPMYRTKVHERLDWDKIRRDYHSGDDILRRERYEPRMKLYVKRIIGVRRTANLFWPEYKDTFMKKKYWGKSMPAHWFHFE